MTTLADNLGQVMRRCHECGYRILDTQLPACTECGSHLDLGTENIFLRGSSRGRHATLATASGFALIWPLIFVALPVYFFYWTPSRAFGVCLSLSMAVRPGYELIKRLSARPDGYVLACLNPRGFVQVDALPRWRFLDATVPVVSMLLIVGALLTLLDVSRHRIVAVVLFVAVAIVAFRSVRRSLKYHQVDLVDIALDNLVPWAKSKDISVKSLAEDRGRLRVYAGSDLPEINLEFDCSKDEGKVLVQLLDRWRTSAIAVAESTAGVRKKRRWTVATISYQAGAAMRSFLTRMRRERGK